MGLASQPESIGSFIHKESSKEKLKTKGLKPLDQRQQTKGLKENSTGKSLMQTSIEQQTKGEHLSKHRLEKLRKNSEIDQFLFKLMEMGLINEAYWSFHAKAIHTLGIQFCNRLAINSLNGTTPQKLYATKIKGAMQVHYKQIFDRAED